ncbi:hypothetical protein L7F22_050572 [Adiantum nelumboides]|nr:hypothetical protein [Adiantum nelumboides]
MERRGIKENKGSKRLKVASSSSSSSSSESSSEEEAAKKTQDLRHELKLLKRNIGELKGVRAKMPAKGEKWCVHCREAGHTTSECVKCDYCEKRGHLWEECPVRTSAPAVKLAMPVQNPEWVRKPVLAQEAWKVEEVRVERDTLEEGTLEGVTLGKNGKLRTCVDFKKLIDEAKSSIGARGGPTKNQKNNQETSNDELEEIIQDDQNEIPETKGQNQDKLEEAGELTRKVQSTRKGTRQCGAADLHDNGRWILLVGFRKKISLAKQNLANALRLNAEDAGEPWSAAKLMEFLKETPEDLGKNAQGVPRKHLAEQKHLAELKKRKSAQGVPGIGCLEKHLAELEKRKSDQGVSGIGCLEKHLAELEKRRKSAQGVPGIGCLEKHLVELEKRKKSAQGEPGKDQEEPRKVQEEPGSVQEEPAKVQEEPGKVQKESGTVKNSSGVKFQFRRLNQEKFRRSSRTVRNSSEGVKF